MGEKKTFRGQQSKRFQNPCPSSSSNETLEISRFTSPLSIEGWTISGAPLDLRDPRILATAAAERHLLEADYDEYAESNASGAAFCRSAVLILMALLLLRHALYLTAGDGDDDASAFFSLFMLRAAGFLLPCYIMAWAISILQRRRQRQVFEGSFDYYSSAGSWTRNWREEENWLTMHDAIVNCRRKVIEL